jgi:hypothetical protein
MTAFDPKRTLQRSALTCKAPFASHGLSGSVNAECGG